MPFFGSHNWVVLGDGFPSGLVTNAPDSGLEANQTPLATGLDVTAEGFLKTGSIPSGTARIQKTAASPLTAYTILFNRLWRSDGNRLIWGAPNYVDAYFAQRNGAYDFQEDAAAIVEFLQIGATALLVCKTTGSYVITNASSDRADWNITDINQEIAVPATANVTELDGVGYVSNTKGLFAVEPDGTTQEVSLPVRDILTTAYTLKCDYARKYIILGSAFAYDTLAKRWFDYRTAGSVWQSPVLQQRNTAPFMVQGLEVDFDKTDTADVELSVQTKVGNRDWFTEEPVLIQDEVGERDSVSFNLDYPQAGRSFTTKITIPSNLKIKQVRAISNDFTERSFDG